MTGQIMGQLTGLATGQAVVEYLANSAWQIPVLAVGAWAMVKLARPQIHTQYWLWVSVLALAIVLPLPGIGGASSARVAPALYDPTPALVQAHTWPHQVPVHHVASADAAYTPAPSPARRGLTLHLSPLSTRWLVGLYIVAIFFAALRLFRAWRAAHRLVADTREFHLAPELLRSFEDIADNMDLALPSIRESNAIAGPLVIGALRPVLLLPEAARDYEPSELRAAFCHELAHIQRRDYLVNLLCEAAMLPISWHPTALAIERRIQQTREMVCDELAARAMESHGDYVFCLVSVTRRIIASPLPGSRTQAMGFFDKNALEERVMRLTNEGTSMAIRTRILRTSMGIATLAAVVAIAMTCHVKPTLAAVAQNPTPAATPNTAPTPAAKPSPQVFATGPVEGDVNTPPAPATPSTPVAIARGAHANVTAEKGEFIHRWKSHDGEPFVMVNHDAHEPDADEQAAVEEQFGHILQQDDEAAIKLDLAQPDIRLDLAQPDIKLDFAQPDINLNLDKIKIDDMNIQLDQKEIQKQIEHARLIMNDPAMKKQMRELQRLGKLDAQRQMAELMLNQPRIDMKLQMDMANKALLDANIAKNLGDHEAQMKEIQRQIESGELKARLDAATKMLEDVKRQLQDLQAKPK